MSCPGGEITYTVKKIKVDGSYAYNVTKSTKKDNSVSFSLPVAGHYYGYVHTRFSPRARARTRPAPRSRSKRFVTV
jgi:hypothetical protein